MKRFKDILCVVEPDKIFKPALEHAVSLAENNQANLTVVTVVAQVTAGIGMPAGGPISADLQAALVSEYSQRLDVLVAPYRQRIAIQTRVRVGAIFLETIREVLRGEHDLMIKTPETCDWLERLFSSTDMHLLRKCPCPVWLTKPQAQHKYRRILAAVDVGDHPPESLESRDAMNRQIIELASSLALSEFAELHVVHAWEAIGGGLIHRAFVHTPEEEVSAYIDQVRQHHEQRLNTLMQGVCDLLGPDAHDYLKPTTHLIKGAARKEIAALARTIEADLVVMGTVARTGIPGFIMGNTAETILNQIDCSVLAIKPPSFVTPVTLEN